MSEHNREWTLWTVQEAAARDAPMEEEAAAALGGRRKPLEQEPLLAARIMIEDCLALLLDVQDIDRLFAASQSAHLDNLGSTKGKFVRDANCSVCFAAFQTAHLASVEAKISAHVMLMQDMISN